MMKMIATILGVVLCLTGIIGFFNRSFLAMDLNPLHDVFLVIFGVVSLYFGIRGTEVQARNTDRVIGVVFAILGLITLFSGAGTAVAGGVRIVAGHVLKLIPGHLEYTTADGVRNLLVGIVGLIAGFMPPRAERKIETKAREAAEKVGGGR